MAASSLEIPRVLSNGLEGIIAINQVRFGASMLCASPRMLQATLQDKGGFPTPQ